MVSQTTSLGARERWIATGSLFLGMIAYTVAITSASVILPQIMTSLRADLDQAQWVLTAFGITQTVVMPMVGWFTSLLGPRNLYLGSLALLCISSLFSSLSWNIEALISFQALNGIGVGLMQPIIMAMMYQIFPPHQRGLALGLSMIGWSVGPALGPIISGYLVEIFNWRAAFYVSIPFGMGGLASAFLFLPVLPKPKRRTMDQFGLLTMAMALVTLLMAVTQGRREGWDSSYIMTLFTIATVSFLLFLIIEWQSSSPLVDLRLFRYVPFTLGCLVVFISTTAFRGTGLLTIVFMQQILDFTPLDVGWAMLAGSIAYGVAVLVAGQLADRMSPNILTLIGLGIFSAASFWLAGINEVVSINMLIVIISLRLISFGVMGSPNNLSTMRGLPEEHVVIGSGIFSLIRSISGTVGTALSATIYDQRFFYHVQEYADKHYLHLLGFQEAMSEVRNTLQWAGEIPTLLSTKTWALLHQRLIAEATTAAYQDYFLIAALIGVLATIAAIPYTELFSLAKTFWRSPHAEKIRSKEMAAVVALPVNPQETPAPVVEYPKVKSAPS